MMDLTRGHTAGLQRRMAEAGIDLALLTDPDSIAYFGGFWGYLGIEFGRPTFMLVPKDAPPTVITPLMEQEMVAAMTWVEDVRPWEDAGETTWPAVLEGVLGAGKGKVLGVEDAKVPPAVARVLAETGSADRQVDIAGIIGGMRMVKSPEEIEIMRRAGRVAVAMVEGAKSAIAEDAPEYEVALAVMAGGTRAAAGFLTDRGWDAFVSPMIHNLQIIQSGRHTAMVHRRASVRRLERGDPVYLCFCNMASFKQYKLGFDRQFFVGSVTDDQARLYETTVAAQQAALATLRAGVTAETVHFAAEEVYRTAGFAPGYRTGRAIGVSYLEQPELKAGDKTVLRPGMTFAVDGGITVPETFGARIGDSVVVTDEGFEYLTDYPRNLAVL